MTTELQRSIERFQEQMRYVDDLAMVVLKGHLLIEEALTRIIEQFLFHPKHLADCKLSFFQKVQLAQGFCLRKNQLKIWDLILAINSLRNVLAHALESPERHKKMERVKLLYFEEATEMPETQEQKKQADYLIASYACALSAGFLSSFEIDARAFRQIVDAMDDVLNPGKQEKP